MIDSLHKIAKLPTVKFVIVVALLAFLVKIPAGVVGSLFVHIFGLTNPLFSSSIQEPTNTIGDILLAVVLAPFIETFLAQLLPIEIIKKFLSNSKVVIIISSLVFMLMHYPVLEFFPSAFMVGLILAWAWTVKRDLGLMKTCIIVSLIHSLHNVFVALTASLLF